jgi:gliding motility-associated-like protein
LKSRFLLLLFCFLLFTGLTSCKKASDKQCPDWTFYIPNSFEPNGDGINDSFGPKGTGIANFEMWIFDNTGKQIYNCNSINSPWNGRVQGGSNAVCPEGYYEYQVKAIDSCGNNHTYTGTVILLK